MTWIKICGITNLEDAQVAVDAGADALGFVFYEKSPRNIRPQTAGEIVAQVPAGIEKVGVLANQTEDSICALAGSVGLTAVQMHGNDEDPHVADLVVRQCSGMKVIAAISIHQYPEPEAWAMMWEPNSLHAFLVDSANASQIGGTGEAFAWEHSRKSLEVIKTLGQLIIAGGLTPDNVTEAMRILRPWGVDVSSGVEVRPGKKDPEKVRAFIKAVRAADKTA